MPPRLRLPRLALHRLPLAVALILEVMGVAAIVFGVWMLAGWWAAIVGGVLAIALAQGIGGE